MVAQGAQADFHGQEILHKTGAAYVIQCNKISKNLCRDMLCIQVAAMERDSTTKGFQGADARTSRAEDERRKMAKKCGPLTHSSSSLAQRPFEFFLPAKKRGEKLMNSIKCHFRWRGEIGIVEEREEAFSGAKCAMSIRKANMRPFHSTL